MRAPKDPTGEGGRVACARVRGRLAALVDHDLPALDDARDRGHLEACAGCRAELEGEELLRADVRALSRAQVADDVPALIAAVMERTRGSVPARRAPRAVPLGVLAAAAAILVCFALLGGSTVTMAPLTEVAALEPVLERLPSLPEVLRGLGRLTGGVP